MSIMADASCSCVTTVSYHVSPWSVRRRICHLPSVRQSSHDLEALLDLSKVVHSSSHVFMARKRLPYPQLLATALLSGGSGAAFDPSLPDRFITEFRLLPSTYHNASRHLTTSTPIGPALQISAIRYQLRLIIDVIDLHTLCPW